MSRVQSTQIVCEDSLDTNVQSTQKITEQTQRVDQSIRPNQPIQPTQPTQSNCEVVFFAKYKNYPRPGIDNITCFFNNYGTVTHVICPHDKNFAFIAMDSLNIGTDVEYGRINKTISQIIHDLTPETQFHITVANSNRRDSQHRNSDRSDTSGRSDRSGRPDRNTDRPIRTDRSGQSYKSYNRSYTPIKTWKPYMTNNSQNIDYDDTQYGTQHGTQRSRTEQNSAQNTNPNNRLSRYTNQNQNQNQNRVPNKYETNQVGTYDRYEVQPYVEITRTYSTTKPSKSKAISGSVAKPTR